MRRQDRKTKGKERQELEQEADVPGERREAEDLNSDSKLIR